MACVQFNKGNCTFLNGPLKRNYRHTLSDKLPQPGHVSDGGNSSLTESPTSDRQSFTNYDVQYPIDHGNNNNLGHMAYYNQNFIPQPQYMASHQLFDNMPPIKKEEGASYFEEPRAPPTLEGQGIPPNGHYIPQGFQPPQLPQGHMGYSQNDSSHSSPHTPVTANGNYASDQYLGGLGWRQYGSDEEKSSIVSMSSTSLASLLFPTPPTTVLRQTLGEEGRWETEGAGNVSKPPPQQWGAEEAGVEMFGKARPTADEGGWLGQCGWNKTLRGPMTGNGFGSGDIGIAPQGQGLMMPPVQAPGGYFDGGGGVMWEDINSYC